MGVGDAVHRHLRTLERQAAAGGPASSAMWKNSARTMLSGRSPRSHARGPAPAGNWDDLLAIELTEHVRGLAVPGGRRGAGAAARAWLLRASREVSALDMLAIDVGHRLAWVERGAACGTCDPALELP